MENTELPNSPETISKNTIIFILLILVIFSLLGINLLSTTGNILENIKNIFAPIIYQILSIFGYTTGSLINVTADAVTTTSKTGIDIAHGTIHDVGDLLKKASEGNVNENVKQQLNSVQSTITNSPTTNNGNVNSKINEIETKLNVLNSKINSKADAIINSSPITPSMPTPDASSSPIQTPIATSKMNWCLVGEYQNRRGCIEISDQDKCVSGQIFPDQKTCMNPLVNAPTFLQSTSEKHF
jgi:hypothetical protein